MANDRDRRVGLSLADRLDQTCKPQCAKRNVANRSYWSSTIGGYLTQGDPRSVWLSMTTDF
ncbi:hypothetical protein [Burkholderia seminalis]|uniref:hypothetical protein n=1 Tax=Burkholderia seminalis TaxID=488731 RepID=UPI001588C20F|nr:hypothetical protein [Burkholderia seminalis]